MMKSREEYLEFCKAEAMEEIGRGNLLDGLTGFLCDLEKHPDTKLPPGSVLTRLGLWTAIRATEGDRDAVVRYIKGFN